MKNKILFSGLFLMIFGFSFGQSEGFYVTSDADGYTNVRRQPNSKSDIKTKLKTGSLVYSYGKEPNEEDKKGDWHGITYQDEFGNTTDEATVFIHKSKLKRLESLPALKKKIINDNTVQLIGKNRVVTVTLKKFNPKEHKITEKKTEGGFKEWTLIDGKDFLGTDHTPHIDKEYVSIKIKTGNHEISLPKSAFASLYNADNSVEAYEDTGKNKLYIVSYNGDGAGAYNVAWEIENGNYVKRITVIPF